jgi:hypothetical protein
MSSGESIGDVVRKVLPIDGFMDGEKKENAKRAHALTCAGVGRRLRDSRKLLEKLIGRSI